MSKAVSVLMPRRSGKFVHEIMRTLELAIRLRELGAENFRLVRKSIGPMSEEQVTQLGAALVRAGLKNVSVSASQERTGWSCLIEGDWPESEVTQADLVPYPAQGYCDE